MAAAMARGCGSRTSDILLLARDDVLRVEIVGVDRPGRAIVSPGRLALGLLILRVICVRYDVADVVVLSAQLVRRRALLECRQGRLWHRR